MTPMNSMVADELHGQTAERAPASARLDVRAVLLADEHRSAVAALVAVGGEILLADAACDLVELPVIQGDGGSSCRPWLRLSLILRFATTIPDRRSRRLRGGSGTFAVKNEGADRSRAQPRREPPGAPLLLFR